MTRNPAEILGVEDRVGTLEPGTDADVVVRDGPPFDLDTDARHVLVDGEHAYDRERGDGGSREPPVG